MNQIKAHLATFVKSISENVERIQQYDNKIPQIEIDILLESVRNFYTNVLELNKNNIGMDNSISHITINTLQEEQINKGETNTLVEEIVEEDVAEIIASDIAIEAEEKQPIEEVVPTAEIEETQTYIEEAEEPINDDHSTEEENNDNSEEVFETMVENEIVLQDIANDDDILSPKNIIEFESVEYEKPVEETIPEITYTDTKEESTPTEIEEEVAEDIEMSVPTEEEKEPTAEPTTTEKTQPQHTEEHEEPRQISLFDYLKSSNVSRAAEQVDRFSGVTVKTLADKFQESKEKEKILFESAHEREPQKRRIDDLRTIIGINDKILFMTDLFNRNMKAYNDFILQLNKISDTQTALEYLKTIEETYKWDKESLAVQSFIKIFERKFK